MSKSDGIFMNLATSGAMCHSSSPCSNRKMHTDFYAFRPRAILPEVASVLRCWGLEAPDTSDCTLYGTKGDILNMTAETWMAVAFKGIINNGRVSWLSPSIRGTSIREPPSGGEVVTAGLWHMHNAPRQLTPNSILRETGGTCSPDCETAWRSPAKLWHDLLLGAEWQRQLKVQHQGILGKGIHAKKVCWLVPYLATNLTDLYNISTIQTSHFLDLIGGNGRSLIIQGILGLHEPDAAALAAPSHQNKAPPPPPSPVCAGPAMLRLLVLRRGALCGRGTAQLHRTQQGAIERDREGWREGGREERGG